jgi:predicted flavoprotein YhiN
MAAVLAAGLLLAAMVIATGCSSPKAGSTEPAQTPLAQPENPLVPANTAKGTVDSANNAANELQNQVDQTP